MKYVITVEGFEDYQVHSTKRPAGQFGNGAVIFEDRTYCMMMHEQVSNSGVSFVHVDDPRYVPEDTVPTDEQSMVFVRPSDATIIIEESGGKGYVIRGGRGELQV